jgi:hypothetical protein
MWIISVCFDIPRLGFSAELQDPTRPMISLPSTPVSVLTLNGILVSHDRRIAMINGKIMQVGDHIGNVMVIAISANTVELRGEVGTLLLTLLPNIHPK